MSLEVAIRTFPEQQVVTIKKHLCVPNFQQYIPEALKQIDAFVSESGAQVAGDPFCFYHGPVNESDDGPVEIGLPVLGQIESGKDFLVSIVPAHQAATVRTPLEQSQYPEIIEAWDAVVAWVPDNRFNLSDEPVCCYEIWHEDFTITVVQPFEEGG